MACQELEKATFPEEAVAKEVVDHAVPVQLNVLKERELTKKFRVPWTPTFLFLDADAVEHHRFMGYLPPDEFEAQVHLAGAKAAFNGGKFDDALKRYSAIVERFERTDAAPESLYWMGVCEFKLTKDVEKIYARCREVVKRFPTHLQAKKLAFIK